MSLTIFIDSLDSEVAIVRWFKDPKAGLDFACPPVVRMPLEAFRADGYGWVQRHFEVYAKTQIRMADTVRMFQPGEAKKVMKGQSAIMIDVDPEGNLVFSPRAIQKYSLIGLEALEDEHDRTVPQNSPPSVFWRAFDEVLAIAKGA